MRAQRLRVDYLVDPIGLDEPKPQLSWELTSGRRGDEQVAYRVVVADSATMVASGEGNRWDTGRVPAGDTFGVVYAGSSLASRDRCWWAVQTWDADGADAWSEVASWEMGLLHPGDWSARWIEAPDDVRRPVSTLPAGVELGDWRGIRPSLLRREFASRGRVTSARAYVTARGLYQLSVNGRVVGEDLMRPGWTDYRTRIQYQVYDVTELIRTGANVAGLMLASGWYAGRVAWEDRVYGDVPSVLVQLELTHDDGGTEVVSTDEQWQASASPLLWSDLLMGEAYDARLEQPGWDVPGADVAVTWQPVVPASAADAMLVADRSPRVRRLAELPARGMAEYGLRTWVFDLGQNITGWIRLRLTGRPGTVVQLRFGEMLEPDGAVHTANLRTALATDIVILADGETVFEPRFTQHGFRYVELRGLSDRPPLDAVTGVVVGTDNPQVGSFECSSPLVAQLQRNIEWGQRGNFLEVPTDCPQRDERLGWTADLQIFLPTACWNADTMAFVTKWLTDLVDTQRADGAVADVAPLVRAELFGAAAPAWGDAIVLVPWTLYQVYGDRRLLERCFPAMCAWVDYVHRANPDLLWINNRGNDYGDWLSVDADTPKDLVATAYFARSTDLTARAAAVLGRGSDADRYASLFERIRTCFQDSYVTPRGRLSGGTQTAYALALAFELVPPEQRAAVAGHLVDDVAARGTHLSTGFVGAGHLLPALSATGHTSLAFRLLEQDTFPSWGYPIRYGGATTVWERWDAWTHTHGFKGHGMNSFNHYAFGAVGEWLYTHVAGLRADAGTVALREVVVEPGTHGDMTWARATHQGIRGTYDVSWRRTREALHLDLSLPPNVTARVLLPARAAEEVRERGAPCSNVEGVRLVSEGGGFVELAVRSGSYAFESLL